MAIGYQRTLCLGLSGIIFFTAACSTTKHAGEAPRTILDQQTVAVMITANAEEAERLRLSLLRGQPLPPSAQLFSIEGLTQADPTLGKLASQLADCEISRPIAPANRQTSTGYLVLQRGGDPDRPCHGSVSAADEESWSDKAGALLLGLLMVGVAGFLIAAPFIFHVF
jgi:hypothetical protein